MSIDDRCIVIEKHIECLQDEFYNMIPILSRDTVSRETLNLEINTWNNVRKNLKTDDEVHLLANQTIEWLKPYNINIDLNESLEIILTGCNLGCRLGFPTNERCSASQYFPCLTKGYGPLVEKKTIADDLLPPEWYSNEEEEAMRKEAMREEAML